MFDNTGAASQCDEIDRSVSRAMADAWVQFAKRGNPNGGGLPQWPMYPSPDYRVLDFGDTATVRSNAHGSEIEFFRRVFETLRAQLRCLRIRSSAVCGTTFTRRRCLCGGSHAQCAVENL